MKVPVLGLTYSDVALVVVPAKEYEPLYFVPLTVIYFPSAFLMRKYICLFLSTLLLAAMALPLVSIQVFITSPVPVLRVLVNVTVPVLPAVTVTVLLTPPVRV